ncbi:MAG: hypothetical protein LBD76_02500 [Prevotellaceae bacterium]|jgi:hypothetical protein|nr:hypothetical protein [Prevotellaceae bacterium]
MNKFNKILMMFLSLAFLMSACKGDNVDPVKEKEDPYFDYKSATDYWFPKESGDTVIAVVDVNRAYYAKVAEGGKWCTVTDIAVNSFRINYEANKTSADRTTKITLSMEGVNDIEIVVSQRGTAPALVLDTAKYAEVTSPYLGVDTIIPVATNGNYKVEIEAGNEWCRVANMTEINYEFGTTSATVSHYFTLNIDQNSELGERSAKVTVSLSYQDSTVLFEFVVKQAPTPILLIAPANEEVIEKATGFPYTISWNKTGGLSGYSILISSNSGFPENATKVITVGDVDSYTMSVSDIAEVFTGHYRIPLYWKVMPADPSINIATETKTFYVLRKLIASYPLTLNGGDSSWISSGTDDDGNFWWSANAGQSSRRTWVSTHPLTEAIEGKVFAIAYEYKTSNKNSAYDYNDFWVYHFAGTYDGNWTRDEPGARYPYTNEWSPVRAPLTATREWGAAGSKATMLIRPIVVTSSDNSIAGMWYHVRELRAEVYEE